MAIPIPPHIDHPKMRQAFSYTIWDVRIMLEFLVASGDLEGARSTLENVRAIMSLGIPGIDPDAVPPSGPHG